MIHPILELTGHLYPFSWSISSFGDHREVIGAHSLPQNGLWHPWYIIYKIWYIFYKFWYIIHKIWYIHKKKLVHPILELLRPLSYYPCSVYSFTNLWKMIGSNSLLRHRLWNLRYILEMYQIFLRMYLGFQSLFQSREQPSITFQRSLKE